MTSSMGARPTPPHETTTREPALYLLPMLAVRVRVALPDHVARDRDAAAEYALRVAREQGLRACLVWDRRSSYWVVYARTAATVVASPILEGAWVEQSEGVAEPHARIGGRPAALTFE